MIEIAVQYIIPIPAAIPLIKKSAAKVKMIINKPTIEIAEKIIALIDVNLFFIEYHHFF